MSNAQPDIVVSFWDNFGWQGSALRQSRTG
jgi:hypothetical protein